MSLVDALLLDAVRMNVWIAIRTEAVPVFGTGTQSDPFDGGTAAKFDALMNALPLQVSSIAQDPNHANIAIVTAINHPYSDGDSVLIDGVTSSAYYNGTFSITYIDSNTFKYMMNGSPGAAEGTKITCRLCNAFGPIVPLPLAPPFSIRLGPGTFQTQGYADGVTGGWQPRPGMKIVGSGTDVTILQLAPNSTKAQYYCVGHAVSSGGIANLLDYFEISDLTIDCNFAGFTEALAACGAVRVMGNHVRIRRLKVVNWGTSDSEQCFVVSAISASDVAWVEDCGIEECLAINPANGTNAGPITVFHSGGTEAPPANPLAYGVAPYIRNCFVDGQGSPFGVEIRGLSMAWCKAGVIEGNQVHNLTCGVFQQPTAAQDIVVRNNWFKNVNKGVFLGAALDTGNTGSLSLTAPVATVTVSNTFEAGDFAQLGSPGTPYDGLVVEVLATPPPSGTAFSFNTSITSPASATISSVYRVTGVQNVIIEGNVTELAPAIGGDIIGIHAKDWWASTNPLQDPDYPVYVFNTMVIRDNQIRYLDGQSDGFTGYPMQLNGCMDLLVRNNVVESDVTPELQNARCGAVSYFNNQNPDGTLVQGWNDDDDMYYEELATITDFALVMGLFNKKA